MIYFYVFFVIIGYKSDGLIFSIDVDGDVFLYYIIIFLNNLEEKDMCYKC